MITVEESEMVATPTTSDRRERPDHLVLLAGLVILASVLRFWHLGAWNFQATEMFTLRDSLSPKLTNPRPLVFMIFL
jgi:hypothetical protein